MGIVPWVNIRFRVQEVGIPRDPPIPWRRDTESPLLSAVGAISSDHRSVLRATMSDSESPPVVPVKKTKKKKHVVEPSDDPVVADEMSGEIAPPRESSTRTY